MKTNRTSVASEAGSDTGCVCFQLTHPTAQEVCIAGSFNDWHPSASPMIRLEAGKWAKELALPPGRYEYRFVVDGQWVDDPTATDLIPNPFGTANAVLEVDAAASAPAASSQRPATGELTPTAKAIDKSLPLGAPRPRSGATSKSRVSA